MFSDNFIKTSWDELKLQAPAKNLQWFYITVTDGYEVYAACTYYSLVVFMGPMEAAEIADFEANYKASSTEVATKVELEVKVRESIAPMVIYGPDYNVANVTGYGMLQVEAYLPRTPTGTTPIADMIVDTINQGTYEDFDIPIGETLTVLRFFAGSAGSSGGAGASVILTYDQTAGDPFQEYELGRLYVNANSNSQPIDFTAPRPAEAGDRIRIYRFPSQGAPHEIYGRWEGFY